MTRVSHARESDVAVYRFRSAAPVAIDIGVCFAHCFLRTTHASLKANIPSFVIVEPGRFGISDFGFWIGEGDPSRRPKRGLL